MPDLPFKMKIDLSPQAIAEALQKIIDTFLHAPARLRAVQLTNEGQELDNKRKKSEIEQKELEAQAALDDRKQARQIVAQKAELENQMMLLEIEVKKQEQQIKVGEAYIKQQNDLIELERNRLKLEQEQLEFKQSERWFDATQKLLEVLTQQADAVIKGSGSGTIINITQPDGKQVRELLSAPKKDTNTMGEDN